MTEVETSNSQIDRFVTCVYPSMTDVETFQCVTVYLNILGMFQLQAVTGSTLPIKPR